MHQRKTSPLKVQGAVIVNAVLLPAVLFLLISCGGTAPSNKQAVSHPAVPPPPSLFVLSSHGDVSAFRADGTSLWQAPADSNSDSMPSANGTHLLDTGKMVYVATDFLRAYSRTGQLRWQHDLPYRTDDSLLVGSMLYIVGGGIATAWNTLKGTLQWQQSPAAGTSLTSDTRSPGEWWKSGHRLQSSIGCESMERTGGPWRNHQDAHVGREYLADPY